MPSTYHEGRHGETTFYSVQSKAASTRQSSELAKKMGVPKFVGKAALAAPAKRGTAAGELGRAIDISENERAEYRAGILDNLSSTKDPRYKDYRALPEEEDAFIVGDTAEDDFRKGKI